MNARVNWMIIFYGFVQSGK